MFFDGLYSYNVLKNTVLGLEGKGKVSFCDITDHQQAHQVREMITCAFLDKLSVFPCSLTRYHAAVSHLNLFRSFITNQAGKLLDGGVVHDGLSCTT